MAHRRIEHSEGRVWAGALSGQEILRCLKRRGNALTIMPPLYPQKEWESVLGHSNSIDLRLGTELIVMKKSELATLQFRNTKELKIDLRRFYERVHVGPDQEFMLHPHELVLGAAFEYVVLPTDLMAYITGRSSWGRLGLIIATATAIHPGFKGCPTLEIVNLGNIPIPLFPGSPVPIAQLVFHGVGSGQRGYGGKYSGWVGPTGPGYSKIQEDSGFSEWLEGRGGVSVVTE